MSIFIQGLLALGATFGFSIIFRVPVKLIPACGLVGGIGWALYMAVINYGSDNPIFASFLAAALVGLLSEICARTFRETTTVFTIPGILPLVPGAYIFRSMEALLQNDMEALSSYGADTIKIAAAIAFGLLAIGAVFKVLHSIAHKTVRVARDIKHKF